MGEIVKKARSSWEDVPNECWESIFTRLDHHPRRLQPLSLVCKRFLAITHHLRTTLILPPSLKLSIFPPLYRRLYSRFSNLKSLHLCHPHPSLDRFVRELSQFNLPLQSLHLSHQSHFPREAMRLLGRMRNTLTTLSSPPLRP